MLSSTSLKSQAALLCRFLAGMMLQIDLSSHGHLPPTNHAWPEGHLWHRVRRSRPAVRAIVQRCQHAQRLRVGCGGGELARAQVQRQEVAQLQLRTTQKQLMSAHHRLSTLQGQPYIGQADAVLKSAVNVTCADLLREVGTLLITSCSLSLTLCSQIRFL